MEITEYQTYREEEILPLYASVGWTAYTDESDALREGFARSLLTLAAYEGKTLAGIVRAVGDGATVVLVQDLLVFPQFQRRGIGTALMRAMMERFANVRQLHIVVAVDDIGFHLYPLSIYINAMIAALSHDSGSIGRRGDAHQQQTGYNPGCKTSSLHGDTSSSFVGEFMVSWKPSCVKKSALIFQSGFSVIHR